MKLQTFQKSPMSLANFYTPDSLQHLPVTCFYESSLSADDSLADFFQDWSFSLISYVPLIYNQSHGLDQLSTRRKHSSNTVYVYIYLKTTALNIIIYGVREKK